MNQPNRAGAALPRGGPAGGAASISSSGDPSAPRGAGPFDWLPWIAETWKGIAAVIAISTAAVGAVTYFATYNQLRMLECMTNQNLLSTVLPLGVELARAKLDLAESQQEQVPPDSPAGRKLATQVSVLQADLKQAIARDREHSRNVSLEKCQPKKGTS